MRIFPKIRKRLMESALRKVIHSPLYDRRLKIIILKKYSGRRSFSESSRLTKAPEKEECRIKANESTGSKTYKETEADNFRLQETTSYFLE